MFCILCLCIILCDISKASENLTFVLKQSFCQVFLFSSLSGYHIKDRRTNYVRFISKLWCAWGISVTFDAEVDLNDNFVGRSHYKQFYSVCSSYATENLSLRRRSREPSRVECLWTNFHVWSLTGQHISKNILSLPKFMIITVELIYFMMLSNAFRERTCKHESKRKSHESS